MAKKTPIVLLLSALLLASCSDGAPLASSSETLESSSSESTSSSSAPKTPEALFEAEITKGLKKFIDAERIELTLDLQLSGSATLFSYEEDEAASTSEAPVYTDEVKSTTEIVIDDLLVDGNLIAENLKGSSEDFRLGATSTGRFEGTAMNMPIKDESLDFSAYVLDHKVYIDASGVLETFMPLFLAYLTLEGYRNLPPLNKPFYIETDEASLGSIQTGFRQFGMIFFNNFCKQFGEPVYSNQNHTATVEITSGSIGDILQSIGSDGSSLLANLTFEDLMLSETFTDPEMHYDLVGGVKLAETNFGDGTGLSLDLDLDMTIGMNYSAPVLEVPSEEDLGKYVLYVPTSKGE